MLGRPGQYDANFQRCRTHYVIWNQQVLKNAAHCVSKAILIVVRWRPVDMQSSKGDGWGEPNRWGEHEYEVSKDLVWKCVRWQVGTAFGHPMTFPIWLDCRFYSNQADIAQQASAQSVWTFVSSNPGCRSHYLSQWKVHSHSVKLVKYRVAN
jgi:hypothetical protein